MDTSHTALGFTTSWTNALARRAEHVSVITMFSGELALEPNVTVYSLGKERGFSEPRRLAEFYRALFRILREHRIDACFAHMAPLFAALFAPVGKARHIPLLLWYAHGSVSRTLRIAHFLADRCVTSTPAGFRLPSDKLRILGQGIDTEVFRPPEARRQDYDATAISIGRLGPVKRLEELLAAVALARRQLGTDALRLELTGGPLTPADQDYVELLHRETRSLGIEDAVDFAGPVRFDQIPARYHHGSLFLSQSATGSLDKALLEAMASGCIPISPNESFARLASEHGLEHLVPGPGPEGMAEAIVAARRLPPAEREELRARLRGIVESEHSLDALADRLMAQLTELVEDRDR
jgi:glycosyltransferase involved in cell wall biosynthesis